MKFRHQEGNCGVSGLRQRILVKFKFRDVPVPLRHCQSFRRSSLLSIDAERAGNRRHDATFSWVTLNRAALRQPSLRGDNQPQRVSVIVSGRDGRRRRRSMVPSRRRRRRRAGGVADALVAGCLETARQPAQLGRRCRKAAFAGPAFGYLPSCRQGDAVKQRAGPRPPTTPPARRDIAKEEKSESRGRILLPSRAWNITQLATSQRRDLIAHPVCGYRPSRNTSSAKKEASLQMTLSAVIRPLGERQPPVRGFFGPHRTVAY